MEQQQKNNDKGKAKELLSRFALVQTLLNFALVFVCITKFLGLNAVVIRVTLLAS
jgi:hypothetical protein